MAARGEEVLGCDSGRPEEAEGLAGTGVEVSLDVDGVSLLERARCVVKSPGVPQEAPVVEAARARGTPLLGELEIAWRMIPNRFIAVTDRIIMDFCDLMGGQEAAMPIVRRQMTRAAVDGRAPTREGLRLAVEYLAEAESDFRNAADVEATKKRRLGWIKEVS